MKTMPRGSNSHPDFSRQIRQLLNDVERGLCLIGQRRVAWAVHNDSVDVCFGGSFGFCVSKISTIVDNVSQDRDERGVGLCHVEGTNACMTQQGKADTLI
jgi:hypothetical protein